MPKKNNPGCNCCETCSCTTLTNHICAEGEICGTYRVSWSGVVGDAANCPAATWASGSVDFLASELSGDIVSCDGSKGIGNRTVRYDVGFGFCDCSGVGATTVTLRFINTSDIFVFFDVDDSSGNVDTYSFKYTGTAGSLTCVPMSQITLTFIAASNSNCAGGGAFDWSGATVTLESV